MTSSFAQTLLETNQRLRFWLDSLVPEYDEAGVPTPEQMAALLSDLLRVGASLRDRPISEAVQDPGLEHELQDYRRNVEHLRDTLPAIHRQLLAERARLEGQRARVQSAAEWARASRQTL